MNHIVKADARHLPLLSGSVHCVVTSPPFWAMRMYPVKNAIGHELIFDEHIDNLLRVFRELHRVLREDGSVWMEYGDSWAQRSSKSYGYGCSTRPGNLQLLPFHVAIALQDDGWYLRSVCIWHKPNAMPESVKNRPPVAHSYVFLLTKQSSGYFFDIEAERQPPSPKWKPARMPMPAKHSAQQERGAKQNYVSYETPCGPPLKTVWSIPVQPSSLPHYAAYPEELVRRCISMSTSTVGVCPICGKQWVRNVDYTYGNPRPAVKRLEGDKTYVRCMETRADVHARTTSWRPDCDCPTSKPVPATVLDPFAGTGTTLAVARSMGRNAIGLDIVDDYCRIALTRTIKRRVPGKAPQHKYDGQPSLGI